MSALETKSGSPGKVAIFVAHKTNPDLQVCECVAVFDDFLSACFSLAVIANSFCARGETVEYVEMSLTAPNQSVYRMRLAEGYIRPYVELRCARMSLGAYPRSFAQLDERFDGLKLATFIAGLLRLDIHD